MSENKIKVLIVPSDNYGCGRFRSIQPAQGLQRYFPEKFDVDIDMSPDWENIEALKKYDIIHFHKGLEKDQETFWNAITALRESGVKILMDVDDAYWFIDRTHPTYHANERGKVPEKVRKTLQMVDWVTTTTPIFEKECLKYNKNVKVLPNGLFEDEPQVLTPKVPSKNGKIRFGFIMGSSHEPDLEILRDTFGHKDIWDKAEFHLCGYDIRGTMTIYQPDGSAQQRPIKPEETCWYRFEQLITNKYDPDIVSPEYKAFLNRSIPDLEYPKIEEEKYVRQWTRDINNYLTHYDTIDVLLVPLKESTFNSFKSQLKLIEAAFKDTAVICSDSGPYTLDTVNFFGPGSQINENGNAILIEHRKDHKDWVKAIKKIVEHPEYVDILKKNLADTIKPKYNMKTLSEERAAFYESVMGK